MANLPTPPLVSLVEEVVWPLLRIGAEGASSSNPPHSRYQHSLRGGPFPTTEYIWIWRKGERGHVMDSLEKALVMLEDVHF